MFRIRNCSNVISVNHVEYCSFDAAIRKVEIVGEKVKLLHWVDLIIVTRNHSKYKERMIKGNDNDNGYEWYEQETEQHIPSIQLFSVQGYDTVCSRPGARWVTGCSVKKSQMCRGIGQGFDNLERQRRRGLQTLSVTLFCRRGQIKRAEDNFPGEINGVP
jgi:hypothetical protein